MQKATLEPGQITLVRQRRYLVEEVVEPKSASDASMVSLSCLDDDAQGEPLTVLWEHELDARVLTDAGWLAVGNDGFDDPALFAAYLRTLSWNCVTATDPNLFQSPFRAGIRLDAYQLEPLRKALRLPRVNLFIADDVGLGKTIETGLIVRELLLRRRINRIVVACPPSMLEQWRDELEERFGLTFAILDRNYVAAKRRERGFSVNPWKTHSRFLISHSLLIDEAYTGGLRDWLGEFAPKSLLILDEAHHVAPSSGGRYAIDSQITRAIRDIAPRFEHRLFLSATPHNGHSNSFSALLEILDPQRFTRGVRVLQGQLDEIMVRRLKSDIRELSGGFPERKVVQIDIDGLPPDAAELTLAAKLDSYRSARDRRLADASAFQQAASSLVIGHLQKRLLSSIDAFARTLTVHRRSVESALFSAQAAAEVPESLIDDLQLLNFDVDLASDQIEEPENANELADDGLLEHIEEPTDQGEDALHDLVDLATALTTDASQLDFRQALEGELTLVDEMGEIAEGARYQADRRIQEIVVWIGENMCPGLSLSNEEHPAWNDNRVIIFTEYEDTRRYIEQCLNEAISHTDRAAERIAVFSGATSRERRLDIRGAFNTEPKDHPLRILIATDAAREGLNLQRHCSNLFHFDLPWNPSRLDQRNGRIDRKLQPADEVFCRYFVFNQRPEDRVLEVLVKKSETIRQELGSAANVLDSQLAGSIGKRGIKRDEVADLENLIDSVQLDDHKQVVEDELEAASSRQSKLMREVDELRDNLERSRIRIGITESQLRQTLSMSLRLSGAPGITETAPNQELEPDTPRTYVFPAEADTLARDLGWAPAIDTLRRRRERGVPTHEWRRNAEVRPVVFEDPGRLGDNAVHLHLEHRVAQRLLSRFTSQGLIHHDLAKACLASGPDSWIRLVLIGRLSVYGPGAARLHEEIVPITARWFYPEQRQGPLVPFQRDGEHTTLESLRVALDEAGRTTVAERVHDILQQSAQQDIADLLPHLEARADGALKRAETMLAERAEAESQSMAGLLKSQQTRIQEAMRGEGFQMPLDLDPAELRQYEADRRAWERRLQAIEQELATEPARIADSYSIRAHRVDPIGLVYLWPKTG